MGAVEDPRSDAQLLRELRDGRLDAYAVLWERHIGAALRHARRLLPSRAEDLASEAFLAIYQQVTTSGGGPDFAFRSYLKAVMRNTAIRWRREADRIDDTVEADAVDFRDALSMVERESSAGDLLGAFQDLPERWQKVLWLSEVAEAGRPAIAEELGIKPNAVSALHRRARSGLKLEWLTRQLPVVLRDDPAHAARHLPRYLTEPDDELTAQVDAHLKSCGTCSELLVTLRSDSRRLQSVTLSAVGFGALGVLFPATSSLAPVTAVAAAVVTGAGIGIASLLTGGIGAITVGGVILASLFTTPSTPAPLAAPPARIDVETKPLPSAPPPAPALPPVPAAVPVGVVAPPSAPRLGRRNADPAIESVDLVNDPDAPAPVPPTRPRPVGVSPDEPGTDPDVGTDPGTGTGTDPGTGTGTDPGTGTGTDPGPQLTPGVTSPATSSGYLAPQLEGRATPGSTVLVDLDGSRYAPPVAQDGTWSFDPRGLELPAGTYEYRVRAGDGAVMSAPTVGTFTVLPIVVEGFEEITGFEDMLVTEASTTGLVIALTGPANSTVYITSMGGHSAMIPLDGTGHAVKRLRMHSRGWYWFTFRALDADGYVGPMVERPLDVYDPDVIFDPWGPSPEEMTFDVVDP